MFGGFGGGSGGTGTSGGRAGIDVVLNVIVKGGKQQIDDLTKSVKGLVNAAAQGSTKAGAVAGGGGAGGGLGSVLGGAGAGGLGEVSGIMGKLGGLTAAATAVGAVVTAITTGIDMMLGAFEKIGSMGEGIMQVGFSGLNLFKNTASMVLHELAPIEQAIIRIKALGKLTNEQAIAQVELAQDLVKYTPFQEEQVIRMSAALVAAKVSLEAYADAQGRTIDLAEATRRGWTAMDQTAVSIAGKMKVTAASMIADLAAQQGIMGERMDFFIRGFERALQTGQLRMLDELPAKVREKIFGNVSRMKGTAKDAMDRLYKYLQESSSMGQAALASSTVAGILSNFRDVPLQIAKAIGGLPGTGGLYDKLRDGLAAIFEGVNTVISDPKFLEALREGFAPALERMADAMVRMRDVIKELSAWLAEHPNVIKYTIAVVGLGSSFLVVAGAALTFAAALGTGVLLALVAVVAVVLALSVALLLLLPALGLAVLLIIPLTVGLAVAIVAVAGLYHNLGDLGGSLMNVVTLISAVIDALQNWNGETTSISEENAKALGESGMLGTFGDIIVGISKLVDWWDRFTAQLSASWHYITPQLNHLGDSFGKIWDSIKKIAVVLGLVGPAAEDATGSMKGMGEGDDIIKWTAKILDFIGTVADMMGGLIDKIAFVSEMVSYVLIPVTYLVNAFQMLWNIAEIAVRTISAPLYLGWMILKALQDLVWGLGEAILSGRWDYIAEGFHKAVKEITTLGGLIPDIQTDIADIKTDAADIMRISSLGDEQPAWVRDYQARQRALAMGPSTWNLAPNLGEERGGGAPNPVGVSWAGPEFAPPPPSAQKEEVIEMTITSKLVLDEAVLGEAVQRVRKKRGGQSFTADVG